MTNSTSRIPITLVMLAALSSCEEQYPPLPADTNELMDNVFSLMQCYSAARPEVFMAASPRGPYDTGEVTPASALECGRNLYDRMQIQLVPRASIGSACRGGLAEACTVHDFNGCGGDVVRVADDIIPTTLTRREDNASSVGFTTLLHHEFTHTQQSNRFGSCGQAREVEAYGQQLRISAYLGTSLAALDPRSNFTAMGEPCLNSLDAAGLDPCIRDYITSAFPSLDPATPFPAEACNDIRDLASHLGLLNSEANASIANFRDDADACLAGDTGGSSMGLRETSPTYEVITTVFASSTTITQLQPDNVTGALQVVRTTATGLDEILDLRVVSDGPVDVFVVAGRLGTSGVVQVYEDVDQFEFGRDGTIDRLAHQITHPLLREATNLVPRNSGLAVWDLVGQRVMLLEDNLGLNGSSGSDGYPDSINPIPAVQIPSTHLAESFAFDETGTRGFAASARATLEDINVDGMLFDDSDGDDVFDFIDDGRPIDSDLVPSSFLFAPSAGQPSISLAGPVGHTLRLHAASIDGTVGAPLGSAVATSNRLADVPLSRALVEGETVRIVNGTREVPGPFAVVGPARPQIRSVVFSHVRPGATVRLVGQGLSSVTSFQLGGSPVSGAVVHEGTATAFIPLSAPLGVSDLVVQDAGGNSARAPVRVDAQGPIVFDAASDFGSWLTAGFACTDAVLAADPPPSLDSEGCALSDATPVATLTSPTIDTSVLGTGTELEVVLVHRPDFSGGDGGVLQASLDGGATWESLGSSSTDLASVSSADCHPLGNPSQCTTDSEFHGALGFTRTSPGWRTDTFRLPPTGSVRLRLGATRYADGGRWPIDALMVRRREGPASRVLSGDPLIVFDETCPSGTGGSFDCVSPVDGANAAVLALVGEPRHRGRPSGAPPPDEASILLPMDLTSVPVGSQASLTLRHRYDFRRADLVRNGGAYIDVCCAGGCMRADPVAGYPGVLRMAGDEVPAFTDEGVERVWASEVFDISGAAGQLCEVRLTGRNLRGGRADMGWQVDRLAVEWR